MNIKSYFLRWINLWPPFLFTGIKAKFSKDYRQATVKLKLRFWNANYIGTQYGGSLFSMADPFYTLMLLKNLGPEYFVISKEDNIRFLTPGRTDVTADFHITDEDLEQIKKTVHEYGRMDWIRDVDIKDQQGKVIAQVKKTINIKKRKES